VLIAREILAMPSEDPTTLADYEHLLRAALEAWSQLQRVAFVAALAERWLGAYEEFADAVNWGKPDELRSALVAVWDHVRGNVLSAPDRDRRRKQVEANAPDTEDFDDLKAWQALIACQILDRALECCVAEENTETAVKAGLAAFEATGTKWPSDSSGQKRAWKRAKVQAELAKQLALLEQIGSISSFDDKAIEALRGSFTARARKRRRKPAPKTMRGGGEGGLVGDIEAYRKSLSISFAKKTPAHRIVVAAATAERLLPFYQTFAEVNGTIRPERLQEMVESLWLAAKGKPIAPDHLERYQAEVRTAEPPADQRDRWVTWRVLGLALACCSSAENTEPAVAVLLAAYDRVVPRELQDQPEQAWKHPLVQAEISKQIALQSLLSVVLKIDALAADTLRRCAKITANRPFP
jgi:uncharacterized protein YjaG (DUF416 family)